MQVPNRDKHSGVDGPDFDVTQCGLEAEYIPQAQSFVTERLGSIEAARDDLGFLAKTPLRDGIGRLIDWRHQDKARTQGG